MNEFLQSDTATSGLAPALVVGFFLLGIWAVDRLTPGRLPDHFDNNMNAATVAGARMIAVGSAMSVAWVTGYSDGLAGIAVACVDGLCMYLAVSVITAYAYRGAANVVQKTGPLLPCAVLVASAQAPAALLSIASILV